VLTDRSTLRSKVTTHFVLAFRYQDSVTYAVYDYEETEKYVIFSDGHEMRAAPHQLTTQTVRTNKLK